MADQEQDIAPMPSVNNGRHGGYFAVEPAWFETTLSPRLLTAVTT